MIVKINRLLSGHDFYVRTKQAVQKIWLKTEIWLMYLESHFVTPLMVKQKFLQYGFRSTAGYKVKYKTSESKKANPKIGLNV